MDRSYRGESRRPPLFDERHFVNLAQRGRPLENPLDRRLAKEAHAFFARRFTDFGRGTLGENHLADAIGEIEQPADGHAALVARAAALDTTDSLVERVGRREHGIEGRLVKL